MAADTVPIDVFVALTDTLGDDFDPAGFPRVLSARCARALDVVAAGVLLTDERSDPRAAGASSAPADRLELVQQRTGEGPGLDCFRSGEPVSVADLPSAGRWPRFTAAAAESGFAAVHSLPMRLRDDVIGALDLFGDRPGPLGPERLRLGRALADVATIGLLHRRAIQRRDARIAQLQAALDSRVVIEQAKGVVAERLGVPVDAAFTLLRDRARRSNTRLSDLAAAVVDGSTVISADPPA